MNDKRHNRCDICGRPTPRDWDGVRVDCCRAHRILPETGNSAGASAVDSKSRTAIGMSVFAIFGAVVGVIAEILLDSESVANNKSDQDHGLSSNIGHYPGKEYDDGDKPLGWVGHGHAPDTDRYIGPGNP